MLQKPTFLIDIQKVQRNIEKMHQKAKQNTVIFRPHFKTHQSAEIGELFKKQGIDKITVSSVSMAHYFAGHGWKDITIAFPVNLREIDEINHLAGKIHLNILVESAFSAEVLAGQITHDTGFFIEFDNGYHRSGLLPTETDVMDTILVAAERNKHLRFEGFLTHAGNTYDAKSKKEILAIMQETASQMNLLKTRYKNSFSGLILSYGDTPSCSLANDLSAFDELRPGNFVYYDLMQYHLGACTFNDIAVAVACPVAAVYPKRNELILYGGAVHLSEESLTDKKGRNFYGYIVRLTENGWTDPIPDAYVSSLSQEHGIVSMHSADLAQLKPGDLLGVLPVHSCLTADLLKEYNRLL